MRTLAIDIETYSSKDLTKCGVYGYVESEDFEILLFAYAFDEEPVKVVALKEGEKLPRKVFNGLTDSKVIKTAFNANFERTCIAKYFHIELKPEQWRCTAVHALTLGLPSTLEGVCKCLRLKEMKMAEGKSLIKYFSMPCASTKSNGFRNRNLPQHGKEKWETFKAYCIRDVEVERNIRRHLEKYPLSQNEQKLWCLDQRINDGGIRVDEELIYHALRAYEDHENKLLEEALELTNMDNPLGDKQQIINIKSAAQVKKWLFDAHGLEVDSLSKEAVASLMEESSDDKVKQLLTLRQQLSKTSIKKYEAMKRALCRDGRIRGLLQFYGANRTGRWAGRLVQVQNLPQNKLKDLDMARTLLNEGKYAHLEMLYESVPEVLSQLIRTAFIPRRGWSFIAADFSAIEARVIAWLAGERWRMEVFKSHGKIYEASASKMFKVPVEAITKESGLRQKGKIAELALGYQGSKGALIAMGALKMGLEEKELSDLVAAWRKSNSAIVSLWSQVEKAAIKAVREKTTVSFRHDMEFIYAPGILFIKLPSGRRLSYIRPLIEKDGAFKKEVLTYEGVEQGSKQWVRLKTYGGKLVENIVQAIARDCLAEAMLRLEENTYDIVMHIHDEVVVEAPAGCGYWEEVRDIICWDIPWAKGLPLRAEAFEGEYYRK